MFARVLCTFLIFCTFLVVSSGEKTIEVSLRSKWNTYPLHIQVGEILSSHGNDVFWKYVESLREGIPGANPKDQYEYLIQKASTLIPRNLFEIFKLKLTWKMASPRLNVFSKLFEKSFSSSASMPENDHVILSELSKYDDIIVGGTGNLLNTIIIDSSRFSKKKNSSLITSYSFDHFYPLQNSKKNIFEQRNSTNCLPLFVLYGDYGRKEFWSYHDLLAKAAVESRIRYIYRPYVKRKYISRNSENLVGYGAELYLKSSDYKVLDDSLFPRKTEKSKKATEYHPSPARQKLIETLVDQLKIPKEHVEAAQSSVVKANFSLENEFKQMRVNAIHLLKSTSDPLLVLEDISQNSFATAPLLKLIKMNQNIKNSYLRSNQDSDNAMIVNGEAVSIRDLDIFALIDLIETEIKKFEVIRSLTNFSSDVIFNLLEITASKKITPLFDLNFEGATLFLNDLENDIEYRNWEKSLRSILYPIREGNLERISRNLYTIIVVLNPTNIDELRLFEKLCSLSLTTQLPVRIGYLLITTSPGSFKKSLETDLSIFYAQKMFELRRDKSRFLEFLRIACSSPQNLADLHYYTGKLQSPSEEFKTYISKLYSYTISAGFTTGMRGKVFLNGRFIDFGKDYDINHLSYHLGYEKSRLQFEYFSGNLKEKLDIYEHIVSGPGLYPGFSEKIFSSAENSIRFAPLYSPEAQELFSMIPVLSINRHNIIDEDDDDEDMGFSHVIIADWTSHEVLKWIEYSLFEHKKHGEYVFIDFNQKPSPFTRALHFLVSHELDREILVKKIDSVLNLVLEKPSVEDDDEIRTIVCQDSADTQKEVICSKEYDDFLNIYPQIHSSLLKFLNHISLDISQSFIREQKLILIANGRLFELSKGDLAIWDADTWEILRRYETDTRGSQFDGILNLLEPKRRLFIASQLISFLNINNNKKKYLTSRFSDPISIGRTKEPKVHVSVVLDPMSLDASKLATLLKILDQKLEWKLDLYFHTHGRVKMSYFKFSCPDEIKFDSNGQIIEPSIQFLEISQKSLLTLNLHTPERWLIEPVESEYDLDNIYLETLPDDVIAVYELENILVEGSCSDLSENMVPPNGLQLIIGDEFNLHMEDTLVMSNLGYFQLKANPGIWKLNLASGKSSEIYEIVENREIIIDSFTGVHIELEVRKKPEKIEESLYSNSDSIFDFFNWFKRNKNETINVFSVASGHLYERFLRIMMISVKKNTKSPVKFWIIKNFLSPTFKRTIYQMADRFGFEVELIQYKWPSWLRMQTEKQRLIWGYKILFLDVIFPLSLKRVIFIDADQVVRTDLAELYQINLNGEVYGFTPFCSGEIMNKKTKDYRFWETGFWKEHLSGKPYHISALFVVDLQSFRARGVGDNLRAVYDRLSMDPSSLANLDQDLPNYVQHIIPIHSLDREWLWCESWCTEASKSKAKTIDLCNNPLTKTPKLENALKIIPEWPELDGIARSYINSLLHKNQTQSDNPLEGKDYQDEL